MKIEEKSVIAIEFSGQMNKKINSYSRDSDSRAIQATLNETLEKHQRISEITLRTY
jgi:hypothetical protein